MNFTLKGFNPLHDNVIVKPIKLDSKDGFKRPQQEEDKAELGEVILVGNKVENEKIKPGVIVLFNKYSSTKTDLDDFLIVREEDIVAVKLKK